MSDAVNATDESHIEIDYNARIIWIYGVAYTLDLFKHMGTASIGAQFEIVSRSDGTLTLKAINLGRPVTC